LAKRLVKSEKQLGSAVVFARLTRVDEEGVSFRIIGQFGGMRQRGAGVHFRSTLGFKT